MDESYRHVDGSQIGLLSCVLVHPSQGDGVRAVLSHLAGGRGGRLHWRHENTTRRLTICDTIAASGVSSTTWITPLQSPRHQERARRRLLESALYDLRGTSVRDVIIESRHAERDGKDQQVIAAFTRQGVASAAMDIRHGRPTEEPLLWLPDAVAGAVGDDRCGEPSPLMRLGASARVIEVEPR